MRRHDSFQPEDHVTWREIRIVWAFTVAAYFVFVVGGAHLAVEVEGWLNAALHLLHGP